MDVVYPEICHQLKRTAQYIMNPVIYVRMIGQVMEYLVKVITLIRSRQYGQLAAGVWWGFQLVKSCYELAKKTSSSAN